jgi:hypothetical protein
VLEALEAKISPLNARVLSPKIFKRHQKVTWQRRKRWTR